MIIIQGHLIAAYCFPLATMELLYNSFHHLNFSKGRTHGFISVHLLDRCAFFAMESVQFVQSLGGRNFLRR